MTTIVGGAGMPLPFLRAIAKTREPEVGRISITELLRPPQQRALHLQYMDEVTQEPRQVIDAFFGTAIHQYLEGFALPGERAEQTLEWKALGWTVHGTPDFYAAGELVDWKTTKVRGLLYDKPEWEAQTNLYAHLLRLNDYEVTGIVVWAYLRDWDAQKRHEPGYPADPLCRIDIPLWDAMAAHTYILDRLKLHKAAARGRYDACTADEKWQRDEWAVMSKKAGAKRAARVFKTEAEAVAFQQAAVERPRKPDDWFSVEHRPGLALRCMSYCAVAPWCDQRREELDVINAMGAEAAVIEDDAEYPIARREMPNLRLVPAGVEHELPAAARAGVDLRDHLQTMQGGTTGQ